MMHRWKEAGLRRSEKTLRGKVSFFFVALLKYEGEACKGNAEVLYAVCKGPQDR